MSPTGFTSYKTPSERNSYGVYTRTNYEYYEYTGNTDTIEYWSNQDKFDTSFTVTLIYPTREIEKNIKKLLKKMADNLCKEGWIQHNEHYNKPEIIPVIFKNIRLEGRGWKNKKI